ncbi:MAG: DUF4280 domain-containing protein [Singulisphaera sp.]
MPRPVVISGALLKCIAGSAPSRLAATTAPLTLVGGAPIATVVDHLPIVHVKPFGVCAITGRPCLPLTLIPWQMGASSILAPSVFPILSTASQLPCLVGGIIRVLSPGQFTVFIDASPIGGSPTGVTMPEFPLDLLKALGEGTLDGLNRVAESLLGGGVRSALSLAALAGIRQYLEQSQNPDCRENSDDIINCMPHLEPPNDVPGGPGRPGGPQRPVPVERTPRPFRDPQVGPPGSDAIEPVGLFDPLNPITLLVTLPAGAAIGAVRGAALAGAQAARGVKLAWEGVEALVPGVRQDHPGPGGTLILGEVIHETSVGELAFALRMRRSEQAAIDLIRVCLGLPGHEDASGSSPPRAAPCSLGAWSLTGRRTTAGSRPCSSH